AASIPFLRCSAGYVGVSDGWTDLSENMEMDWEFDCAPDGNIALTGELDLECGREFTLCLAFGQGLHDAVTALFQSLGIPFEEQKARFVEQWERAHTHVPELKKTRGDGGRLQHTSQSLLLAHEDKLYPGAIVASLSIPWGEAKTDTQGEGGYHIVWTRDMVNSATALLATGNTATPLRALIYLAVAQRPDGGFYQNFWVDGEPYWHGVQLDEVAYPIILAWRLWKLDALQGYDPYPMIRAAARYLIQHGPATPQDRWEEAGGYSPSTLATNIAALTCAADMMRNRGNPEMAAFVQDYADFLESHLERWTVTTEGTVLPEIARHYIRINPAAEGEEQGDPDPNRGILWIANRPPASRQQFPAKEVVSGDFLELVRYGIRPANDTLIEDSIRVIDHVLRVETPHGPVWRRYNHDGYGQRPDGGPFLGWGKGRPWPLLTGERGHYELAAGRPVEPYIHTLEAIARRNGLLPEQVWDDPDLPGQHLYFGGPTGAATPLLWAHAEYIKLIRSAADGQVFDWLPPAADRYLARRGRADLEVWKLNRRVETIRPGTILRLLADAPFCVRWTRSEWQEYCEIESTPTGLGVDYADIRISASGRGPVDFTFYWPAENRWEGRDYRVAVVDG
ncbi:MAG: glycoside hydrolase family 15 protein, partial [Rudaea sp.]